MSLILFFLLLVFCFSYFLVVVFRFLFPCLSLLCSLFLILLFLFPAFSHCVTKKPRSNHRISEMFVLIFRFGACILAVSLGPAKKPLLGPEMKMVFVSFLWLLTMCRKYLFLQCFLNINQNFPQSKWALKKMITFHNAQNQNWCFRNGSLG